MNTHGDTYLLVNLMTHNSLTERHRSFEKNQSTVIIVRMKIECDL